MNWPDMTVVWFGTVTSVSGLIRAPLFGHSSLVLGEGSGVRTSSRANRRIRSGRLGNDNEGGNHRRGTDAASTTAIIECRTDSGALFFRRSQRNPLGSTGDSYAGPRD